MLLENPSLLALQSEIRFQSEHPSMHFLLDSEASKQLWLALMTKSCFASLFGYCYVLSLLLLCCKGRKIFSEFRKVGARSARDGRGAFDGFQTRILFISVSSSSLLEPISVDDEESARSPRWKVLFVGTHHRLSCHAANANFSTFCCRSTRSALELRNSHLKRSFQLIIFPPSLALLSRASQTQSLLVSDPVHARCLPVYTLCSSLNGNFITYLAFSSFCLSIRFRQTGIAARRREKKSKAPNITVNV